MYFIYILYTLEHDRNYIGSTENVEARLKRHNHKMVPSTKPYTPWELVYTEFSPTRALAEQREKKLRIKRAENI